MPHLDIKAKTAEIKPCRRKIPKEPWGGNNNRNPVQNNEPIWVDNRIGTPSFLRAEYRRKLDGFNNTKQIVSRLQNRTFALAFISLCIYILAYDGSITEIQLPVFKLVGINIKVSQLLSLIPFILTYLVCDIYKVSLIKESWLNDIQIMREEIYRTFGFEIEHVSNEIRECSQGHKSASEKKLIEISKTFAKRVQNGVLVFVVAASAFIICVNGASSMEGICQYAYMGSILILAGLTASVIIFSYVAKTLGFRSCRDEIKKIYRRRDAESQESAV